MEKLSNVHFAEASDYIQDPPASDEGDSHPQYPGSGIVSYRQGQPSQLFNPYLPGGDMFKNNVYQMDKHGMIVKRTHTTTNSSQVNYQQQSNHQSLPSHSQTMKSSQQRSNLIIQNPNGKLQSQQTFNSSKNNSRFVNNQANLAVLSQHTSPPPLGKVNNQYGSQMQPPPSGKSVKSITSSTRGNSTNGGQSNLPLGGTSQIGSYGQQIINTVPMLMKQAHATGPMNQSFQDQHVIDEQFIMRKRENTLKMQQMQLQQQVVSPERQFSNIQLINSSSNGSSQSKQQLNDQKSRSSKMSSQPKQPFALTNGYEGDNEPIKPLLTASQAGLSLYGVDLQKEYEKQDQRIEESKELEQATIMPQSSSNQFVIVAEHQYNNNTPPQIAQMGVMSQVSLKPVQAAPVAEPVIETTRKVQWVANKMLLVNTNHCRTELDTVQYVIDKCGYRETGNPGEGDILWYGLALRDHDIDVIRARNMAVVNRYPLMDHFARKNVLCVILSRLQRFFPEDFAFTPASFLLPDEVIELEEYMRKNPNYTFIAKPSKGRGGDGIFLVRKFHELPRSALTHDFLVQRYIENPFLVDRKKFDLRLYVVIKGVDPLEAYLCDEGLARFCTSNYSKPDHNNIKNLYMHLTNFSLNKNSDNFITPEEEFYKESSHASKRLLTNIYKTLQSKGKDVRYLKKQIANVVALTIIAIEPYLKNAYHCFISGDNSQSKCFQILGLDILIDEQFNAWLMEVNANPSLNVYVDKELPNGDIEQTLCELDKYVKSMLLADTFKLVTNDAENEDPSPKVQGSLKRILPDDSHQYTQYYLYSHAETIFQFLAGNRGSDSISSSQFQKLSKFQGMTSTNLLKAHYDIIYKNIVRKSENNQMDLNSFFDAMEEIACRLFKGKDPYENISEVVQLIMDQIKSQQ